MDPDTYVYVQMGDSGLTSHLVPDFECISGAACIAGAVYEPGGGGLNVSGCKKSGVATCSGTCKYCSGRGVGALCRKSPGSNCIVGGTLVTCGTETEYTCVWAASPPAVPAGQPIATDNGCYCGTTPGTATTRTCQFAQCI
ncbi:MAG: hypothetical protein DYG92_13290 [Leptolyngbya sp. PLA1]|nr:hypothetical protein [Leptolyngbya sp. PLA1]